MSNFFDRPELKRNFFESAPEQDNPAPTSATPLLTRSQDGDFMRGLKRTLPELKQLGGGTMAAIGDVTGWDGLRDKGLQIYRDQEAALQPNQRPTDSASEAWKRVKTGDIGAGVDFLQNAAGYTTGQALESLTAAGAGALIGGAVTPEFAGAGAIPGAIGGFVAKQGVKRLVKSQAEKIIADQVAKGVAKSEAKKVGAEYVAQNAAKDVVAGQVAKQYTDAQLRTLGGRAIGGALGSQGMNTVMELGSVYPDAYNAAQAEGRDMTAGEKARAVGASLAAAGVESAADMFNLGKLAHGMRDAGADAATTGLKRAAINYGKRAAVEVPEGMLREAGTEAVQTGLERYGARQSLTGDEANRDYFDSAITGAVGGGLFGGVAAIHRNAGDAPQLTRNVPPTNQPRVTPGGTAITEPPNAGIDAQNEATGLTPDVDAARGAHPAAAPNTVPLSRGPRVPFEGAAPGSLADAVNATSEAAQGAQVDAKTKALQEWHGLLDGLNGAAVPSGSPLAMEMDRRRARAIELGATEDELSGLTQPAALVSDPDGGMPAPTRGSLADAVKDAAPVSTAADAKLAEAAESRAEPTSQPSGLESSNNKEAPNESSNEARPLQDAGVQGLAERGGSLPESEQSVVPQLRRTGDQAASAVGAELSDVPAGGGAAAGAELHAGTDGQRQGLPAGQRALGNAQGTGEQPAQDAAADLSGADHVADGMGGTTRAGAIDTAVPPQSGRDVGGEGVVDAAPGGQEADGPSAVTAAAMEAATSPDNNLKPPSEAQLEAGNFKVGRTKINGLDISIEHPAGVKRKAEHTQPLAHAYGYIRRTEGADGEKVDVFLGDRAHDTNLPVFVVDQYANGAFDESKVMMGFDSEEAARTAYLANYSPDFQQQNGARVRRGAGAITQMTQEQFKAWSQDPVATKLPAASGGQAASADTAPQADQPASTGAAIEDEIRPAGKKRDRGFTSAASVTAAITERGLNPDDYEVTQTAEGGFIGKRKAGKTAALKAENQPADKFAGNTIFTSDKVAAAKARLKSKLGTLNSGVDPETLVDGMTIAGAYIESGVRKFSDYAKAMVGDFGEAVKPYLLSFYEAVRHYPGVDKAGMDTAADAARAFDGLLTPADIKADAIGNHKPAPKVRAKAKDAAGERRLRDDWGVDNIDGWTAMPGKESEAKRTDYGLKGGVKDEFIKDSRAYLKAVADELEHRGFSPTTVTDRKGKAKAMPAVSVNESGVAGSGDIMLHMVDEAGTGIYAHVSAGALRGVVPSSSSGVSVMYRTTEGSSHRSGSNQWGRTDLTAAEFAATLADHVERHPWKPANSKGTLPYAITVNVIGRDGLSEAERAAGKKPYSTLSEAQMKRIEQTRDSMAKSDNIDVKGGLKDLDLAIQQSLEGKTATSIIDTIDRAYLRINRQFPVQAETLGKIQDEIAAADERTATTPEKRDNQAAEAPNGRNTSQERGGSRDVLGNPDQRSAQDRNDDAPANLGGGQPREAQAPGAVRGSAGDAQGAVPGSARAGEQDARGQLAPDSDRVPAGGRSSAQAVVPKADFTITGELDFAGVGAVGKFNGNLAAIRLLKQLEAEGRRATTAEQSVLARYVGWGGLPQAFRHPTSGKMAKGWEARVAELEEAMTPDELAAAGRSTQDAHYTAGQVVTAMWNAVSRLGFNQGRVLEPSMGTGNFFGLMPAAARAGSSLTGVELDSVTGRIAGQLYQSANVQVRGFNDLKVAPESFDLAIGNPPFGSQSIHDSQYPDLSKWSIHNFFFAKSIASLRPGGVLAMVVSSSFLDANTSTTRAWVGERARLLGAIRLPQTAFQQNAGTNVTTDIVFLQRLADGVEANPDEWVNVGTASDQGNEFALNRYFLANPDMMLGRMVWSTHTTIGRAGAVLEANPGQDLSEGLARAIDALPSGVYVPPAKSAKKVAAEVKVAAMEAGTVKIYGYFVAADGSLRQRQPDANGEHTDIVADFSAPVDKRIRAMIPVRDATRNLLAAELSDTAPADIEKKRAQLNKAYDAFVKANGLISHDVNKRALRDDPDFPLLLSLEKDYDKGVTRDAAKKAGVEARAESARKADIFTKRTNYPVKPVTSVGDAKSAMLASLNERGHLDLDYMASLYEGKDADAIVAELGDLVFRTPDGSIEPADGYLSGNVKAKLAAARTAAEADPSMRRNVAALEAVQPADVDAADIFVQIGTPWITPEDYRDFVKATFEGQFSGRYVKALGRWMVDVRAPNKTLANERWGTTRMGADQLMEAILGDKPIVVKDKGAGRDDPPVVNKAETAAALGKANELQTQFVEWVWKDADRRERLTRFYNDTFNTEVRRKYDGAHMSFPGMNRGVLTGGQLRPHQSAFAYRMVQDGVAMADHVVGAGKTYASIAGTMEMRRLGLWRKPMIVVPNHLVDQWATDFLKLYPAANVLAAGRKDFQKGNRRKLFGRIATGDWDAVIVAHSSFGFIPVPAEAEARILKSEIREIENALDAIRAESGKQDLSFKQLQKRKEALDTKIKKLNERKRDDLLDFAEMGVDSVVLDEAHEFKNLFFVTSKRNVAGLGSPEGSKKAFDLYVKTRMLAERDGGKNRVFLTGTPVSNTLSEVFHMQRYLQRETLEERGISSFDAWASVFGQIVSDWEMDAAGRFKEKTRFRKFANLPELVNIWRQVADTVTRADLMSDAAAQGQRFPLPKIKGGKPQNIVVPRSPLQAEFIGVPKPRLDENGQQMHDPETGEPLADYAEGSIIYRMDNMPKDPSEDNHLKATGDARKAGLDFRLVDPAAPDFAQSKANVAVGRILDLWKANDSRRGTQLVFCDLSVPASARGKATESAQAKQPTWFVRKFGGRLEHVAGVKATLSAMPDHPFFTVKDKNSYSVYDAIGAVRIADGRTKQDAIDDANAALAAEPAKMRAQFEDRAIPPEEIDAYIQAWEDAKAEKDAAADDEAEEAAPVVSMDELLADQSKFSVYDDMKAKLVAGGMPPEQVAFIHDYNTDLQKADLFAKVNRGDIRVLFGSTQKMGAGMNVQRKLVALHHMDAPWRPSDLEQREGRIIRQGNEFYEADPDGFEIAINRYGTAETYDAKQWEIIQTKAEGIEIFKAGDATVREIDDISSEAANAADMKGAASGNPLILESIKLRKEIKDLEAQERSFTRARNRMETLVRQVDAGTTYAHRSLAEANEVDKAVDSDGPFQLTLDGKTFAERKEVKVEPVLALFKEALDKHDAVEAGRFRNMRMVIDGRESGRVIVHLMAGKLHVGDTSFRAEDSVSAAGFVARLENIVARIQDRIAGAKDAVAEQERQADQASEELKRGFPKAAELATKRERSGKVVAALRSGKRAVDGDPVPEAADPVDSTQVREDAATYGDTRPLPSGPERARVESPAGPPAGGRSANVSVYAAPGASVAKPAQALAPRVKVVETGRFNTGIKQVTTWQDAAHIVAPLRKSAQENMIALVLTATGHPLAVIRHSIGTVDGASVEPWSLIGAIAAVPNAKRVYFAHNHPSGAVRQSAADLNITNRLGKLLDGSGIEAMGMIVVAPGSREASFYGITTGANGDVTSPITAAARGQTVPIMERKFQRIEKANGTASNPSATAQMYRDIAPSKGPGLLLLSTRHDVIGYFPVSDAEMARLRTGDTSTGTAAVLRAIHEANAAAAVVFAESNDAGVNLGKLLNVADVRLLDIFIPPKPGMKEPQSMAAMGLLPSRTGSDGFRSTRDPMAKPAAGQRAAQVRAAIAPIVGKWGDAAPRVQVVDTAQDLPDVVRTEDGWQDVEGWYDGKDTVYLVAGNLTSDARAARVLAHEAVGHYGIEAIVGEREWGQIRDTVYRMMKSGAHPELFAEINRRYKGVNEPLFVREAVAVMAEKGMGRGVVSRVVAAMRRFLRTIGFELEFSERELRDLIGKSARYLRNGRRPQQAHQVGAVMSFAARPDRDWNAKVQVTGIAGGAFGNTAGDLRSARLAAQNYLRRLRDSGNMMANSDTGWRIGLSGASIKELLQFDREKLNLLIALPRITHEAILADTRRVDHSEGERDSTLALHTFYAPVALNGEPRIARLVVREDVNGNYAYDLQQSAVLKEESPAFAGLPSSAGIPASKAGARPSMTVGQLRDAVNAIKRPSWTFSQVADTFYSAMAGQPLFSRATADESVIAADTAFVAGLSDKERQSPVMAAFAEGLWRTEGTSSPFFQHWFGDSKVVDAAGKPLKVYHGTNEDFAAFDAKRLGKSTNHMTAALGIFTDARKEKAQHYAEIASANVPAEQQVYEMYLSIQNPYNMDKAEFMGIDSIDAARAMRARLQREGFDGIHLTDIGQWVAFSPEQIKRTDNRGTFNPGDARMKFSNPDPEAVLNAMDARGVPDSAFDKLRSWWNRGPISSTVENTRPSWLGALALRHLADLGKDINLSQVDDYAKRVQQMTTDRNGMQDAGAKVAKVWEKFQKSDRAGADATANLMHDTTIAAVDPSRAYVPLMTGATKRGGNEAVTAESIARRIALVDAELDEALSEPIRRGLVAERVALEELLTEESARLQAYPDLVRRYQALPEKGREVYESARQVYDDQSKALRDAIIARIKDAVEDGSAREAYITQVRHTFEDARVRGPYFPLARFGEFWINAEKDGKQAFFMYENVQEWRAGQTDLARRGYVVKEAGRKIAEARSIAGVSSSFMADLEGVLKQSGASKEVMDDVWQMYLRTLPDLSMRKHFIHRKKVEGYSGDALRAFSGNVFHGSYQIARVRHSHKLAELLDSLKKATAALAGDDPERAAKAAALTTELGQRHEWVMNPKDSKGVSWLTSLGFVWYLGATPAAAAVNLTQTAIVTFPVLASRFGVAKAWNTLAAATGRALRNVNGDLTRGLSDEERTAFALWEKSGAIDRTMAHNLAGLSETDTRNYNPVARRGMELVSLMFHKAEVVNREATALAAFRLARAEGQDFHTAVQYAADVITESHFDYSNANRARWMQSNAAKVLLLFRQYSLNMTWLLWRNFYLSTKGESKAVRTEARKKLAGVLGMTSLFTGVMGMPLMGLMMDLANAAAAVFGDDDDPFDAETEFRNFLADLLGPDVARILTQGPMESLTGIEFGSRVGLNELWLRSPDRELEGQAMADYLLEQAAGPVVGGMLVNTLRGSNMIAEGNTWRGVETMAPKSVKDAMKAMRYGKEGVNTMRGDPLIEDVGLHQTLMQLAGFTPATVTEQYDANSAAKNYEQRILGRRRALLNAYAMAWRAEDADGTQKAMAKIQAWNGKHPAMGITLDTIRRSLANRMRYSARAKNGIVLDRRIAEDAREQARFAE